MLFTARTLGGMGAPPIRLQPLSRHFPQWSRTAILTYGDGEDQAIQVKKSPPEPSSSGFVIGSDAAARVAHLEHSVRFLQEQHRLMLSGLHAEIEALRERNRDLQFQLIFNKETSPKTTLPVAEENADNSEEANLKLDVSRLEREAGAARGEARAAEARALQLQRLLDAQTDKLRSLELSGCACSPAAGAPAPAPGAGAPGAEAPESRASLRARLSDAERLVRRLRGDAERQRREVQGGAVTNLLFDPAHAHATHLQCMKSSLHASLRASGLEGGYGFHNNYHFPPVHAPDFWREPIREEFAVMGRGRNSRRPLTLPELSAQQIHRSTVYANPMVAEGRLGGRGGGERRPAHADAAPNTPEEHPEKHRLGPIRTNDPKPDSTIVDSANMYPELKIVVTKIFPQGLASTAAVERRGRRHNHRKHASEHT